MNYCEKCGKKVKTKIVRKKEEFMIYNEKIEVDSDVLICEECGEELFDETLDNKTILKVYQKFREKHRFLFPDEIKQIREQYGLSQRGFAKLLNWGDKTIFRYENGSLQDRAHDSIIKMLKDPENMRKYLNENELNISEKQKDRILKRIDDQKTVQYDLGSLFNEEPSINNGYRKFDYEKYSAMIRYFVVNNKNMLKVKLLKLMNYADMLYFSEHGVSISGSEYIHYQYGPVPNRFNLLFDLMIEDKYLVMDEIQEGDYLKYQFYPGSNEVEDVLTSEENEVLNRVNSFFKKFGSKEIADYSHNEKGYIDTEMYEVIPYSYSSNMKI